MNGILVINKESNYTSRDIVNILNKELNTKKIGHTGTLDPLATGVLVVCIGKYTKLVDKITCYDKEYIATIKLGMKTDTLDITGNVLEKSKIPNLKEEEIKKVLNSFLGKSLQEVPKYAAIKVNGKKLYEYARKNEEVILPKREIEIKEIELLNFNQEEITFRTVVSKGTYIRSLIRDICEKLGVLGTMSKLTRTRQGNFTIEKSYSLQDVIHKNYQLLNVEDIFNYPNYELTAEEYFKVKNGCSLNLDKYDMYIMLKYQNKVVAIYQKKDICYHPYFML